MKVKIAIILVFVAAALAIVFFQMRSGEKATGVVPAAGSVAAVGPAGTPVATTEISMLFSSEKKEWMEAALVAFNKEHPEIKVTLRPKGSLSAAADIVDGKEKPAVWSPADSLVQNLLAADYKSKYPGQTIFAESGEDAPNPLVITPLVFVIWEDRAEVLLKAQSGGAVTWKAIHKAVASNEGWPAIKGKAEWGFVKLGYTDPTQSNSGLQALLSMSLEYHGKTMGLDIADVLKPKYQEFIKELAKGVQKFETSTGQFMTDMIRFGPSKYDIAVVYENLAISQLEYAQGRWGNLRVYYPQTTIWSDHPIAVLKAPWVTPAQTQAARVWVSFLRSKPMQELALTFGFRPGDPSVPVKSADPKNPFVKLAPQGIKVDINPMAVPPDGTVIRNLMMMWSRVVAK